jgi:NAD(P)-dependent dehydrogenase (short-subunit alcohol dehydrogenase family)
MTTAIVTGGAEGIGRVIALRLLTEGYQVAVLDTGDLGPLEEAAAGQGHAVLSVPTDVSDAAAVTSAFAAVSAELPGPLALLVNNAGIFPRAAAEDLAVQDWRRVLDVNLTGSFLCSQAFFAAQDSDTGPAASIVMMGSALASKGAAQGAHYAASKAGLGGLTRSLARAWAPRIRVNMVLPGITDTAQLRRGAPTDADVRQLASGIPMGRLCQAADVAGAVVFLAGPDASYITGQTLSVTGGDLMA